MKRILRNAVIILILLVVAGTVFSDWRQGFSILVGGVLALLNIHWLMGSAKVLSGESEMPRASSAVAKYMIRLVLIFGTLFAMIHFSFLGLWGAVLGLSVPILSTFLEALMLMFEQTKRSR